MAVLLQKGIDPDTSSPVWLVLGEDYAPVEPIQRMETQINVVETVYDIQTPIASTLWTLYIT